MYKGFVPISVIIDRIYRRKILKDITEDEIIDHAVSLIKLIDGHSVIAKSTVKVEVDEYRGVIPKGIIKITSVRYKEPEDTNYHPINNTSNPFGISRSAKTITHHYEISGHVIHTSFEKGEMELAVETIALDATGELLIRDDEPLLKAIEFYVGYQHLSNLHDLGTVPDKVLQKYESEYLFYTSRAQSSVNELSLDERESLSNMLTTLIDNRNHRHEFYENLTQQEIRRLNNG